MSKAPWIKFYTSDWQAACRYMTIEAEGLYIRLLMYQRDHGSIPKDLARLEQIAGKHGQEFRQIWAQIEDKFDQAGQGAMANHKMAKEAADADQHFLNLSERAKKANAKRWGAKKDPVRNPTRNPTRNPAGNPDPEPELDLELKKKKESNSAQKSNFQENPKLSASAPKQVSDAVARGEGETVDPFMEPPIRNDKPAKPAKATRTPRKAAGLVRDNPPTLDEVSAYVAKRAAENPARAVDPEAFFDFYVANGWVQGSRGKPVRDWKACVRTWEKRPELGPPIAARPAASAAADYGETHPDTIRIMRRQAEKKAKAEECERRKAEADEFFRKQPEERQKKPSKF